MSGEVCSGCGHASGEHMWPLGCQTDWTHDEHGIATGPDGCLCQWVHITSPTEGRP